MGQVEEHLKEYLVPASLASRLHHHPSQRALSEAVHCLQASQQKAGLVSPQPCTTSREQIECLALLPR